MRAIAPGPAVRPIPALLRNPAMTEPLAGGTTAAPLLIRATAVVASTVVRARATALIELERGRRIDGGFISTTLGTRSTSRWS